MSGLRYDPNKAPNPVTYDPWPRLTWMVAGLVLLGLAVFVFTSQPTQTTSNTANPPPRTMPAETTGSGNINKPALPTPQNTRP